MPTIRFEAELTKIGTWTILKLPYAASKQLPSRGIAMVKGTINEVPFQTALEPDGKGSHWFRVTKALSDSVGIDVDDTVSLAIEPTKDWPEPEIPADIAKALKTNPQANETWSKTTPLAHWEWIRWIRATSNQETRDKRIVVACSKLKSGMRRPCCFNSNMCTEPDVSKGGVLLEPTPAAVA